jgi:O-antigen ligase
MPLLIKYCRISSNPAIPLTYARDALWWAAALAFAPILVFGANGTVILLALMALAVPGFRAWRTAIYDLARTPIGWALGGLLAFSAISLAWAPGPEVAMDKLVRLAILWLAGCAAMAAIKQAKDNVIKWMIRLLPLGVCVALLFYWVELATSARIITTITGLQAVMQARFPSPQEQELFRLVYGFGAISRGAGLLALFVWPAMAACMILFPAKGKWLASAMAVAVFLTILPLPMQAAPLAMVAGGVAFLWTWRAPQTAPRWMAAMIIAVIAIMPVVSSYVSRPEVLGIEKHSLPGSWQHRVEIWHFTAQRIAEKPLLGWGFDASRNIDAGKTQFVLEQPDGTEVIYPGIGLLPLHPHNGVLQVWLEMGAVGAGLVMLLMFGLGRALASVVTGYGRLAGAMATASTASALCVGLLSFGQWQSWWQASLWIGALLCTGVLRALKVR